MKPSANRSWPRLLISAALIAFLISPWTGGGTARMEGREIREAARRRAAPERRTPVDQALWEARGWRVLALQAANRERERLEAWDPEALAGAEWDAWRLQAMARDPEGYMARARAILIRLAAAALTGEEKARVATLRALVEHEAGDHEEELQQARTLADPGPRSYVATMTLRRAVGCNEFLHDGRRRNRSPRTNPLTTEVSILDPTAAFGVARDTPGGEGWNRHR